MYGYVYCLCLGALLLRLHANEMVNGAGFPSPEEEAPTLKSNTVLKALQHHDGRAMRDVALDTALAEDLAKGGVEGMRDLTSQQSERTFKSQLELETINKERMRRSTTYQPYTDDPYDLGPLNQCSTPKVSHCSYSTDVTVPEYQARLMPYLFDYYESLTSAYVEQLRIPAIVDSRCINDAINSLVCNVIATPRCIANGSVKFRAITEAECNSSIRMALSCGLAYQNYFADAICSNGNYETVFSGLRDFGDTHYSLTHCIDGSLGSCDGAGSSPFWLVRFYENSYNIGQPALFVDGLTSDTCKTDYLRASCSIPTCTSDGRLQGTLTFDQCNVAYNCAAAVPRTNYSSVQLQLQLCESLKTIRDPSGSSHGLMVSGNINILLSSLLLMIGTTLL